MHVWEQHWVFVVHGEPVAPQQLPNPSHTQSPVGHPSVSLHMNSHAVIIFTLPLIPSPCGRGDFVESLSIDGRGSG